MFIKYLKNKFKLVFRKSNHKSKIKFIFYFIFYYLNPFKKSDLIFSHCSFCEKDQFLLYVHFLENSSVSKSYNESGFCFFCGSSHRNRVIQKILLKNHHICDKNIYLAAGVGPLFNYLKNFRNIVFSDFFPSHKSNIKGVLHQDLTKLTFKDSLFDIVISEHVMEHIYDPKTAFMEIFRVLKEEGYYIFSIPFEAHEYSKVRIDEEYNEILDKKYHLDPLRGDGALVFNDFGKKDFLQKYVSPSFSLKRITHDQSIINDIKVVTEVVILKK